MIEIDRLIEKVYKRERERYKGGRERKKYIMQDAFQ